MRSHPAGLLPGAYSRCQRSGPIRIRSHEGEQRLCSGVRVIRPIRIPTRLGGDPLPFDLLLLDVNRARR